MCVYSIHIQLVILHVLGNDPAKIEDDSVANLNALRHALGATTKAAAAKNPPLKNKLTKDVTTNGNDVAPKLQQPALPQSRTPPYFQPNKIDGEQQKISEVERKLRQEAIRLAKGKVKDPDSGTEKTSAATMTTTFTNCNSTSIKDGIKKIPKSASSSLLCDAGNKCKTHLNSKELVALGHFNKALLNSDEFDYLMKVKSQEEDEELLPDQIQHYLQHVHIFFID